MYVNKDLMALVIDLYYDICKYGYFFQELTRTVYNNFYNDLRLWYIYASITFTMYVNIDLTFYNSLVIVMIDTCNGYFSKKI